jgi:hypothetical protein
MQGAVDGRRMMKLHHMAVYKYLNMYRISVDSITNALVRYFLCLLTLRLAIYLLVDSPTNGLREIESLYSAVGI